MKRLLLGACAALLAISAMPAKAQDWPTKQVKLVVPFAAGSTPEVQAAFAEYLTAAQKSTEIERQDASREKTGIPLDRFAINPATGERIPIWAADYVLADYGHGAVMAVPARAY